MFVRKFFMFLSKTDRDLIAHCTDFTRKTQVAFGVFVLLTGTLAFLSCMYAVNWTFKNYYVSIPVALVYSTVIVFIDREIVSATTKLAVIPRILLAVAVGLVISVPLEMRLFADRIAKENEKLTRGENQAAIDEMVGAQQAYQSRIDALEKEIVTYRQNINEAGVAQQDEAVGASRAGKPRTEKAGYGPAYREAARQEELNRNLLREAESQLQTLRESSKEVQDRINKVYELKATKPADDLLASYEAMESVKAKSKDAIYMSWGVRALIILLETIPAIIKLMQRESEYTALLEAMRRRNIIRVYAAANDHIDQMIAQPHVVPAPALLQQLEQDPLTR